ncbi:hypothetical protein [Pseudomonas typographi]|uniref:Uncharacterized protein n=1 Tax=Pseudomonas typographi TaxID=2715964 RepID=A0ABR7Z656_9PSED|nr:hypothetical protein [Pseudomonas typographi]MBD1553499.1 hypothetical protein [Pseudomonas typographi]MBD1588964.1 hypothetical protein [Pseudomonas typographi]MBD1600973.1 hypothetical protein [Pseudomonas typographi]
MHGLSLAPAQRCGSCPDLTVNITSDNDEDLKLAKDLLKAHFAPQTFTGQMPSPAHKRLLDRHAALDAIRKALEDYSSQLITGDLVLHARYLAEVSQMDVTELKREHAAFEILDELLEKSPRVARAQLLKQRLKEGVFKDTKLYPLVAARNTHRISDYDTIADGLPPALDRRAKRPQATQEETSGVEFVSPITLYRLSANRFSDNEGEVRCDLLAAYGAAFEARYGTRGEAMSPSTVVGDILLEHFDQCFTLKQRRRNV